MSQEMSPNQWADFWYYNNGVNVIPAHNLTKKPKVAWKEWQTVPIPEELFKEWKEKGMFKQGIAIVCGQVFRGENKGLWINAIDCDNAAGTKAMCPRGVAETAKRTLVEQHSNPDKCHILFYTNEPLKNRAKNPNSEYQIEVKSMSKHLLYCSGCLHKDGTLIDIVGTKKIKLAKDKDGIENKLDSILGISVKTTSAKITDKELSELNEGDNRQLTILSKLGTYFATVPQDATTEEDCIDKSIKLNSKLGTPYDQARAVTIGEGFYKMRMNDEEIIKRNNLKIKQTDRDKIEIVSHEAINLWNFATERGTDVINYYNGKIYDSKNAQSIIKEYVETRIDNCNDHERLEVVKKIKALTYTDIESFDSYPNIVTLENGVFNISTGKLTPHTPANLSKVLIPREFITPKSDDIVANLKDTLFGKSLTSTCTIDGKYDEVMQNTILEMMASTMITQQIDEKAFILLGNGDNGKSVVLEYLAALLGKDNVSRIPLQVLADDKFASANLDGKLANIFTDIENSEMKHTGTLKAICSGEGVYAQHKNKSPFSLYPYSKLIFSCNRFPKVYDDQSDGFFRRWIIIQFKRKFVLGDPDRIEGLKYLLMSNTDEMNLVFSSLVILAQQLLLKQKFSYSLSHKDNQKIWNANADPLNDFVENYIVETEALSNNWKSKRDTHAFYKNVMLDKGENPLSFRAFNKAFSEYYGEGHSGGVRIWLNIDFKQPKQALLKGFE
jgi:putative DNA primase/helicase